ncbi:MAG: 50S ribosomal protein L15 [candidate division WOR-3 bacterium]
MLIEYYPPKGAKHRKKRVGCGPSSGHGKTSTRGHKGSGQRKGKEYDSRFEGGQMPLYRRIPKRGFRPLAKIEYETVNFRDIIRAGLSGEITPEILKSTGLVKKDRPIKILGTGELKEPLIIKAHAISSQALKKLIEIGGKFEALPYKK